MTDRRAFLTGIAAAALPGCGWTGRSSSAVTSAATIGQSRHVVVRIDHKDQLRYAVDLPERGHDAVISADRKVMTVVARRPGRTIAQFRWRDGKLLNVVESAANRHFYGHAVYSPDGRWLVTSENDLNSGTGVLAIRDAMSLNVEHEVPSFGIGPHEMAWHPTSGNLVVANGGIATHPDYGREPLNIESMAPSIVQIDLSRQRLVERRLPRMSKSSVRHIDQLADGTTIIGLQQQSKTLDDVPVVVQTNWQGGSGPTLEELKVSPPDLRAMSAYTASVCCDPTTGTTAVTAPRGHRVSFWDSKKSAHLKSVKISDAAGVDFDPIAREFIISSGRGIIYRFDARTLQESQDQRKRFQDIRFDNHLTITPV